MRIRRFHTKSCGIVMPALITLVLLAGVWAAPTMAEDQTKQGEMIHQLRIYEIFESNKAAFQARFRDHAARIMRRYDFDIVVMWESRSAGRTEFVYVLQWPNEETKTDRWSRFMADQEWADIKEDSAEKHGTLVGETQDRTLNMVDYSPKFWR